MSRNKGLSILVALSLVAMLSGAAYADNVAYLGNPNLLQPGDYPGYSVGWEFTVGANPITVTKLGTYAGNNCDTPVGIFLTSSQALLTSTVVPNGSADIVTNSGIAYKYETLATPITLAANTTYDVASVWVPGVWDTQGPISVVSDPAITIIVGRYIGGSANNTTLQFPTNIQGNSPGYLGSANFQFNVTPEPATMCLLVLGGIGALLRRRK